jgi:MFS family permease
VSAALRRSFDSLVVPNYRRYFAGQVISVSGTWMQTVAEMWLLVKLTGSGVAVGLAPALQFAPILLLGAWGGLLADRIARRRLLMVTQALMALPALALWALTATGAVQVWMVFALIAARGLVTAVDNPARQSFVAELVGPERVVNAVALNSVVVHSARILGPAAAGAVIALAGVGPCFALNALSFAAMLVALGGMDPRALRAGAPVRRGERQLRDGLRYVRSAPGLWIPLAMMAVVGTLAFNFQVLMPLLASRTWHAGASTYALLTAAMGAGSVLGALATGARGRVSPRLLVGAAGAFGAVELLAALAPTLALQLAALAALGAVSVTFSAGVNSSLQLAVAPAMRGRVMSLYAVVFLGSTPFGAPLVGWLAEVAGPRSGLVLGAVAALATAAAAAVLYARHGASTSSVATPRLNAPHGRPEARPARRPVAPGHRRALPARARPPRAVGRR